MSTSYRMPTTSSIIAICAFTRIAFSDRNNFSLHLCVVHVILAYTNTRDLCEWLARVPVADWSHGGWLFARYVPFSVYIAIKYDRMHSETSTGPCHINGRLCIYRRIRSINRHYSDMCERRTVMLHIRSERKVCSGCNESVQCNRMCALVCMCAFFTLYSICYCNAFKTLFRLVHWKAIQRIRLVEGDTSERNSMIINDHLTPWNFEQFVRPDYSSEREIM